LQIPGDSTWPSLAQPITDALFTAQHGRFAVGTQSAFHCPLFIGNVKHVEFEHYAFACCPLSQHRNLRVDYLWKNVSQLKFQIQIFCFVFQQLVKSLRDWFAEMRDTIKRANGKSDSRFGLFPGSISLCALQHHRYDCRLRLETTRTSGSLNHHQRLRTLFHFRIQYQRSWPSSSSHLKITWNVSSHP
jgi:hypothetical protein